MKEKKNQYLFINLACVGLCIALLLGLGAFMNWWLAPQEILPTENTTPSGEMQNPTTDPPPTDPPPTDPPPTEPPLSLPELSLKAHHSFVYILETGEFLMLKGKANDRIYPASLTKLFSTYVALLYMDTEEIITVGNEVNTVPTDSSVAGLRPGDQLTMYQLLEAVLLPSGNDAAVTMAVAVGRKLEENPGLSYSKAQARFVEEMNRLARIFDLSGTHFVNPHGYHDQNHYTTCQDMQKIGQLVLTNNTLRQVIATTNVAVDLQYDYPGGWNNTNLLIQPSSEYYNPDAIGMKTGSTGEAGYCLMSAFQVEGKTLMVGVFGCAKKTDRFEDTQKIYDAYVER